MPKLKLDKNILYIWHELMSERARELARHALARVLLGSALLIAVPYAIGFYLDGLTTQALDALLVGGVLFLGLESNSILLGWWRQQVRERFFQEEFWYLPQAITRKYLMRPLSFMSRRNAEIDGGGVESLRDRTWNVIGSYIFQIIPSYAQVVFGLIACAYANLWLGLVALLYVVIERSCGHRVNQYVHREMRPVIDQFKRWERRMHEWWRSVDHVKSQGVEKKILTQIHGGVQEALQGDDAVWRVYFARAIVYHRLRGLSFALILYCTLGYLVFSDTVTLANGVLVFFSFERIRSVLGDINDQQRDVQFNLASVAKYRRILNEPIPFAYNEGETFTDSTISISFEKVSHEVGEGDEQKLILRDVSLTIEVGEKIGVVGPSGAGKSQLLSLLVRAADPIGGRICINRSDLRTLRLESLLRYYGVVMQQSEPFEDTVLGNLLFGVSHFDLAEVVDQSALQTKAYGALSKAGLDVSGLPNGIYTNIGYKGTRLSGGQQQRLQIAGAHLKLAMSTERPRLILADEPTASLDSLSELTVMQHLQDALPEKTTMLMVAHRLSTVAKMDRIVFVRPLIECGEDAPQVTVHDSLAELYQSDALFRRMADAQSFVPQRKAA